MTRRLPQRLTHAANAPLRAATVAIAVSALLGVPAATVRPALAQDVVISGTASTPTAPTGPNTAFASVTIHASQPGSAVTSFSVLSGGLNTRNVTLRKLIGFGYDMEDALVTGPPALDVKYNLDATAPAPFPAAAVDDTHDVARAMVRNLLADKFRLQVHRAMQSESVYVLTSGGLGLNIGVASPHERGPGTMVGSNFISGTAMRVHELVKLLATDLDCPVVDRTGLTQRYNFRMEWESAAAPQSDFEADVLFGPPVPSPEVLTFAVKKYLGLTLTKRVTPVEVLVVDRAESPRDLVPARETVPMDHEQFDQFAGSYAFPGNLVMTVSRRDDQFWVHLWGERPVQIFPAAPRVFFIESGNLEISFDVDAQGRTTGIVVSQNGESVSAQRVDDATAKQMTDALFAKTQQNTATPGSEQAVRSLMAGIASGKPDYDQMSTALAQATRQQLPTLQPAIASLGSIVSVKFTGVDQTGQDIYLVTCEHGAIEWHIAMDAAGKIANAIVRPAE
jgi:uncharacterized protein (TIGR03435 family)